MIRILKWIIRKLTIQAREEVGVLKSIEQSQAQRMHTANHLLEVVAPGPRQVAQEEALEIKKKVPDKFIKEEAEEVVKTQEEENTEEEVESTEVIVEAKEEAEEEEEVAKATRVQALVELVESH